MHDSEQEHSGITGCRVTYESTIFYNEANKFSIIVVKTSDPRIPPQACSGRYYGDRMLRFTAVGYELPRTKAVELELDGEWVESKCGYQLQVEQWQEIVPQTADGLLAYLGSGLIKGIGPKTAEDIVATFGPDTLNILDNEPEKLLQIRGITEGKLKDIEKSYAESRVLRNLMSLLGPFKITPATALKIYQNFGSACVDILKNARMICARFPVSDSSVWMASSVRRTTACTALSASRARCCTRWRMPAANRDICFCHRKIW